MAEDVQKKFNPAGFFGEVKREASKVTWPTRKETGLTLVMVLIMTVLAAVFFLIVDQVIAYAVKVILGIGG